MLLSQLLTQLIVNDETCFGLNDGSATALVSGGTPPLSYSWTPSNASGLTANGLAPNTYTFTVSDANCSRQ
jgi:hypothetical protein